MEYEKETKNYIKIKIKTLLIVINKHYRSILVSYETFFESIQEIRIYS